MMLRAASVFTALLLLRPAVANAQAAPICSDDAPRLRYTRAAAPDLADFARVAMLAGAASLDAGVTRRGNGHEVSAACVLQSSPILDGWAQRETQPRGAIRILPVGTETVYNSEYARGGNDGVIWAGRGLGATLGAGVEAQFSVFSASLAPVLFQHQNEAFALADRPTTVRSPFAYAHHGEIDYPQRMGPDALQQLHPGQSYARADYRGFVAGVSTENLWWGPGQRYSLMMSNTAPGFPHAFAGTARPIDIRIGGAEAEFVWGQLRESSYFDRDDRNDERLFAAVVASFEPEFAPGLTLGGSRAFIRTIPPGGLSLADIFIDPYVDVQANRAGEFTGDNQVLSLFGRWSLPTAGFEAYAEWARDDHWGGFEDLLKEPDHSQVYALGFQKVFAGERRWVRAWGELIHLQAALPYRGGRGEVTFYTNGSVQQGYTHDGQLMGAFIGPGSDAQALGVDLFQQWGRAGVYVERIRYDDNKYYAAFSRYYGQNGHDVELTYAARGLYFLGPLDASLELTWSHRYNRNFIGLESGSFDSLFESSNAGARIGLAWRP